MKSNNLLQHDSPVLCLDISEQVFEELIISGKLVVEQVRGHNENSKRRLKEILKLSLYQSVQTRPNG